MDVKQSLPLRISYILLDHVRKHDISDLSCLCRRIITQNCRKTILDIQSPVEMGIHSNKCPSLGDSVQLWILQPYADFNSHRTDRDGSLPPKNMVLILSHGNNDPLHQQNQKELTPLPGNWQSSATVFLLRHLKTLYWLRDWINICCAS